MFLIISSTRYTARLKGAAEKAVACERCGCEFVYRMTREGSGQGDTLFNLFPTAAQDKAARTAERELQRKLKVEQEAVPCPRCGHVQEEMVRCVRRESYRGLKNLGMAFLLLGSVPLIIGAVVLAFSRQPTDPQALLSWLGVAAVLASPGLLLLAVRYGLNRLHDPKRAATERRTPDPRIIHVQDQRDWLVR